MEITIPLNKSKYSKAVLTVANVISRLNLSDTEIEILSTLVNYGLTQINADTKELIRKVLDKDKYGLNNYIKSLKDKGVIIHIPDSRGEYQINPSLLGLFKDSHVSFGFNLAD